MRQRVRGHTQAELFLLDFLQCVDEIFSYWLHHADFFVLKLFDSLHVFIIHHLNDLHGFVKFAFLVVYRLVLLLVHHHHRAVGR